MSSVARADHDLLAEHRAGPFVLSVYLSVCLFRKLGLEISFRLRCTSYLLHAETPSLPRRRIEVQKRDTRLFCFCPPSVLFSSSLRVSPRCRVIVWRKDPERSLGLLIERPEIKRHPRRSYWWNSAYIDRHGPLGQPSIHPFPMGVPHSKVSLRPLSLPFIRNRTICKVALPCSPAATRYFVTKLISRVNISSARTDQTGGSVLEAKDTSGPTRSGSQRVTVITRNNLRREIQSLQGNVLSSER